MQYPTEDLVAIVTAAGQYIVGGDKPEYQLTVSSGQETGRGGLHIGPHFVLTPVDSQEVGELPANRPTGRLVIPREHVIVYHLK